MLPFGSARRNVLELGAAVGLMLATTVRGDDYSWNSPGGGNWNEPAKWDRIGGGTGVPGGADNAAIDVAGTYTVNLTDTRAITNVTVNRSTATLNHTSGTFTTSGAFQLTAGAYALSGGTLTQNGVMTTAAGSTFNFTSGTWNGTGSATVGGAFNWDGGSIAGSGTVTLNGPTSFAGGGAAIRTVGGSKTVVLGADATWSGGQIGIDNGTAFRVNAGRVLTDTDATTFWYATTSGGTFDIQGTFRKTGIGITSFNDGVAYDVSGAVEVLGGGLSVVNGATLVGYSSNILTKGAWRVQGSTLNFNTRTVQTIGPNATVILDGSAATFAALDSLTTTNGTLRILGGKTFTPTAASVSVAGTLEVGAGSTFGKGVVVQSGGTLIGAGIVARRSLPRLGAWSFSGPGRAN